LWGDAKREIADSKGALEDYSRAIEIKPNVVEYYEKRSKEKTIHQDYEGAKEDLTKIIEIAPKWGGGYEMRGKLKYYKLGDYKGQLKIIPN
jgi:tetratricopeptide (TPR) repeat protein